MLIQRQRFPTAVSHATMATVLGILLSSCGPRDQIDEPLPTNGPNQVVLKVPRMS